MNKLLFKYRFINFNTPIAVGDCARFTAEFLLLNRLLPGGVPMIN